MRHASLAVLALSLSIAACAASKPTSPTACVTLAGMQCGVLLKQLRNEIPVGTPRAEAEAVLRRHNLLFRFLPKPQVGVAPGSPRSRIGRITIGVDDGDWPKSGSQGYVVDLAIDDQDRVASFHVNAITAP